MFLPLLYTVGPRVKVLFYFILFCTFSAGFCKCKFLGAEETHQEAHRNTKNKLKRPGGLLTREKKIFIFVGFFFFYFTIEKVPLFFEQYFSCCEENRKKKGSL